MMAANLQPGGLVRAAIYLRASADSQKYSTTNQAIALHRYAVEHAYVVVRVYEDDGKSGLDLSGRPGLQQLLHDALGAGREFNALLVYDVSRWGRFQDVDEGAHYEFLCRNAGIKVVYCEEPFENDGTPMAHVMKAVKRSMAAEYSRELSEKVRRGKRRLAAAGFVQARVGYGLRRLLVDERGAPKGILELRQRKAIQSDHVRVVAGPTCEVAVVRKIFRLFANLGMGYTDIANHLNQRLIPAAMAGKWNSLCVRTVLTNETYIGNLVYGQRSVRLKKVSPNPPEEWVRYEGALPPIVPYRLFEQARRRIFKIKRIRTDEFYLRPLRALLKREGFLTEALIVAEPGMPSPAAYKWRFHGLTNAYLRVGYTSLYGRKVHWASERGKQPDCKAMLAKLEALLNRAGYLSARLINSEPEMPTCARYKRAFGSLVTAYELIGYFPPPHRPNCTRDSAGRYRSSSDE